MAVLRDSFFILGRPRRLAGLRLARIAREVLRDGTDRSMTLGSRELGVQGLGLVKASGERPAVLVGDHGALERREVGGKLGSVGPAHRVVDLGR